MAPGLQITRRRMLAASGASVAAASPLVLAACGAAEDENEDTSPAREAELLNQILAAQLAVVEAIAPVRSNAPSQAMRTAAQLRELRNESTTALEKSISGLEGTAVVQPADTVGGESPTEGLARQLEASLAITIEAIGELNPDRRRPVHRAITEDAAALAALRSVLGEEIAPDAFVMGPPAAHADEEAE